jgi:thiamine transport system ATP-binding protein
VFQDFALFPHLDVGDNVAYGLRMLGVDNVAERVADALDMVGLRGMERRRIDQLSGGQAQRVALARTLAPEPRLLLLDEPLGSLDPDLRTELASELKDLLATTGVPTIVVTHDTAEALALGDRIAIIVDGRIACEGTPEQVWSEPGSVDAARLLGHRGIVPADVAGGVAAAGSARIPVDAADGPTTLLIRSGGVTTPGPTPGIVVDSRYRGPEWLVTVAIGRGTVEVLTTIRPEVGASIGLTIDPTSVTSLT